MKVEYQSPEVDAMELFPAEVLFQVSADLTQEDFIDGGDFVW